MVVVAVRQVDGAIKSDLLTRPQPVAMVATVTELVPERLVQRARELLPRIAAMVALEAVAVVAVRFKEALELLVSPVQPDT
jgi:hypothetical protein